MKQIRIIGSILTLAALLFCGWSFFQFSREDADIVVTSLNLIYFFTLLIAFLCFRISLAYSNTINPVISIVTLGVIGLSTYTWINSVDLLDIGKITLGLMPILLGTTLMLIVKANTKVSKYLQLLVGFTALTLSTCVFIGVSATFVYSIALICMTVATLGTIAYLIFRRTS